MNTTRLTAAGKRQLRQASRAKAIASLPRPTKHKWIRINNRYREKCTSQYAKDFGAGTVTHVDLAEYIAGSAIGHVIDGWSLFGRAVDAALRLDTYSAVHLGYYAELRAAMGLLASEGVGVFDRHHAVLDNNGATHRLPKAEVWNKNSSRYEAKHLGTHTVVWPVLRHWAGLRRSSTLLESMVRPNGISLPTWLSGLGALNATPAIAQQWFLLWGLDLSATDDDHRSRNLVSYRPSEFRRTLGCSVDKTLSFVLDLWRCFEPGAGGAFPTLNRFLTRRAVLKSRVPLPVAAASLTNLGLSKQEVVAWQALLNGQYEPTMFSEAEDVSRIESFRCHFQVMARAAFLLAVATASVRQNLVTAGHNAATVAFWTNRFRDERGIFSNVTPPLDAWADIEQSIQDASIWLATSSGALIDWRRNSQQQAVVEMLGAFELVAVWGLVA